MALGHCNHPHEPCRRLTCHMYAIQLACADLASTTQSVRHNSCSCHSVQCQYSRGTLSGAPVACARCFAPGLWQRGTRNTASISDDAAFCSYNCQGRVNTIPTTRHSSLSRWLNIPQQVSSRPVQMACRHHVVKHKVATPPARLAWYAWSSPSQAAGARLSHLRSTTVLGPALGLPVAASLSDACSAPLTCTETPHTKAGRSAQEVQRWARQRTLQDGTCLPGWLENVTTA